MVYDICIHLAWFITILNLVINVRFRGNPIVIDFDNCCPSGQDLKGIGGTWPWASEDMEIAMPSNDLDALWDIRQWLSDSSIKKFKFKEG